MADTEESQKSICVVCPGRGKKTVDMNVMGYCKWRTLDSFLQTRRYGIEDPDSYSSDEALAEQSASALLYCDEDSGEIVEDTGDYDAALLGAQCARMVLSGLCKLSKDVVLRSSDID
jgi:hypothetical protein